MARFQKFSKGVSGPKINRDIRAPKVRVISESGEQFGVLSISEALEKAGDFGLDLVEIAPNADPPVCKIIDYGKLRYQKTKKEREQKKSQHHIKIKEIKLKPNIDTHDLDVKTKHAREFLAKGYKVRFTCMFRGREIVFADKGKTVLLGISESLSDVAIMEADPKLMGRSMSIVVAPGTKEKKKEGE